MVILTQPREAAGDLRMLNRDKDRSYQILKIHRTPISVEKLVAMETRGGGEEATISFM